MVKLHWGQIFLGPWGLPHFLLKGSNPWGFSVSAVLPITGTLTINLNSISISRVLRVSITIYLRFFSHYIEMVLFHQSVWRVTILWHFLSVAMSLLPNLRVLMKKN